MKDRVCPHKTMSHVDSAWLRMDDPTHLMIINGVTVTGEPMKIEEFKDVIRERMMSLPRFKCRVTPSSNGRRHIWEDCEDFDLDEHVVSAELEGDGARASCDCFSGAASAESERPGGGCPGEGEGGGGCPGEGEGGGGCPGEADAAVAFAVGAAVAGVVGAEPPCGSRGGGERALVLAKGRA